MDYCNEVWNRDLWITPASEGYEKVRARLREKIETLGRPLNLDELKLAADGALLDPWMSGRARNSRGYLAPKYVYKSPDRVQELMWLALGFELKTGTGIPKVVAFADRLGEANLKGLMVPCECGHFRLEHAKGDPDHEGRERCFECDCEDFAQDWLEQLQEYEKRHRVAFPVPSESYGVAP